jgi:excisionase family DNA binding protein
VTTTRRREKTETLKQAQQRLGISRTTLWRLIRKYKIEVADDVLDGRAKRVKTEDVDRIWEDAMRVRKGKF